MSSWAKLGSFPDSSKMLFSKASRIATGRDQLPVQWVKRIVREDQAVRE
jgi:hypothetical protein